MHLIDIILDFCALFVDVLRTPPSQKRLGLSPMEEKAHRSSQRIGCGCLIVALAIFGCFLAWIVWD
jgi:hypothetical protein